MTPTAQEVEQLSEETYLSLTRKDCPDKWEDGQPHLQSACRRCLILAYANALTTFAQTREQAVWEEAALIMKLSQGCNCSTIEVGVGSGVQHKPACGFIDPKYMEQEFRRRATDTEGKEAK